VKKIKNDEQAIEKHTADTPSWNVATLGKLNPKTEVRVMK
jgi:hypothetical protein